MNIRLTFITALSIICTLMLSGCFYRGQIRNLASEVSLAVPGQTTQQEIISFMGFPDVKKTTAEGAEEWIYFQGNKSLMRRSPVMGEKMGQIDYDVAIITFQDKVVQESKYRAFSEEEFKQLGIPANDPQ